MISTGKEGSGFELTISDKGDVGAVRIEIER